MSEKIVKKQDDNGFLLLIFFVKFTRFQSCLTLVFGYIPAFYNPFKHLR